MDRLFSNSVLMLESAMNFQWTKMSVINNNIVNAETPGYKAQYVTFEEALRQRLHTGSRMEHPVASRRSAITSAGKGPCSSPSRPVSHSQPAAAPCRFGRLYRRIFTTGSDGFSRSLRIKVSFG